MPTSPTSLRLALSLSLSLTGVVLGLSGCYTVDFDEQQADVYYCLASDECHETQACSQFLCVDDQGPQLRITGPEESPPSAFPLDATAIGVTVNVQDFTLREQNTVEDGFGKLLLAIDPHKANAISVLVETPSAGIPIVDGLEFGPHRITATAVFGDGTPYPNPSATDHTVFFSTDGSDRPQIGILEPRPGHVHVLGEPLAIQLINRGYDFVGFQDDCQVQQGCDPFDPNVTCTVAGKDCTEISTAGHAHVYLLDDYPACLSNTPINCNDDYIEPVIPNADDTVRKLNHSIPAERFTEPGEFMLRAALQYSNHLPYPNIDFVIYDEIPITIVER